MDCDPLLFRDNLQDRSLVFRHKPFLLRDNLRTIFFDNYLLSFLRDEENPSQYCIDHFNLYCYSSVGHKTG